MHSRYYGESDSHFSAENATTLPSYLHSLKNTVRNYSSRHYHRSSHLKFFKANLKKFTTSTAFDVQYVVRPTVTSKSLWTFAVAGVKIHYILLFTKVVKYQECLSTIVRFLTFERGWYLCVIFLTFECGWSLCVIFLTFKRVTQSPWISSPRLFYAVKSY